MTTARQDAPGTSGSAMRRWPAGLLRDALGLVLVAIVAYATIAGLELHAGLTALAATTPLDELLAVGVVVTLALALRGWYSASRELTERRRAEGALGASEERYRLAVEATRDVVYDYDVPADHLLWNGRTRDVFGEAPEAMGTTRAAWMGRLHPDDLARVEAEVGARFAQGGGFDLEYRLRTADGAYTAVRDRGQVVLDATGAPRRCVGAIMDVTERKRATQALQHSERQLATAQRLAHLGSWAWDLAADTLDWSDELYRIFGVDPQAFRATYGGFLEHVHPEDRDRSNRAVQRSLADQTPFAIDLRIVRPDGTERVIRSEGEVERDARGAPRRMVGTALDVTEPRRVEAALLRARDAALSASEAKSAFLANMSHEIRTPMNAILGMADLLADTPLTDEQQEYVGIFRRAGDTLLTLIDDILDLSKVEAGQLTLEVTAFDLQALVEDAAEVFAARAHAKGLELTCEVAPDVPARVRGDPQRLRQVLLNLLGNAVKFTAGGEVDLRLERDPTGGPATVRFSVRDTGIGIAPEQLGAVFGAFTQADASTTRRFGGTGLGLAIVERLVALMGGRIAVESAPGRGATFAFSVPLEPAAVDPAAAPPEPAVELAGARVLVVDDNATNRLILRRLLTPYGAVVTEADGGEAGLTALRAARITGPPYDLVLLDQQMPDLDGFQLVARVRAEAPAGAPGDAGAAGEAVVGAILMLSSDQRVGDAARAQALGITRYLIKPVKRAALLATIVTALRSRAALPGGPRADPAAAPAGRSSPAGATGEAAPPRRRLRLLLVDDSADNRRLVQLYLSQLPYVLETAADGRAGLEAFQTALYDLVLMDVQMPVLDGLAATRAIRAWEGEQGRPPTPVVALTASAMAEDVQRARAAGCDAHLAKPLRKAVLLAALAHYVRPAVPAAARPVAAPG